MNLQYITDTKGHKKAFMYDLKESIEEVKLAKEGKIKLQSAKDFLNEL